MIQVIKYCIPSAAITIFFLSSGLVASGVAWIVVAHFFFDDE